MSRKRRAHASGEKEELVRRHHGGLPDWGRLPGRAGAHGAGRDRVLRIIPEKMLKL